MHPAVAILACHALGLALLCAAGAERRPLLSSALAFPIGLAATAVVAFAFALFHLPLASVSFGVAWLAMLALAVFAARRQLAGLGRFPAAVAAALAAIAVIGARFDLAVDLRVAHDTLLAARLVASGEGGGVPGLPVTLHAAFFSVSPVHAGAFVLALAGATLFAFAALLDAILAQRSRAVVALATAALATSFPLVRTMLTIGSPAAAGLFLLAGGALLHLARLDGGRRVIPLALLPLAACAIDVPASLSSAGRLALLVAPLAAFALIALALGRRPARRPGAAPLLSRADLQLLSAGCLLAALLVAGLEWALLVAQARDRMSGAGQALRLLPLGLGNLLPYVLAASLIYVAADRAARALTPRLRWPRAAVIASAALLAVPYALWLGRYTFSGPQAQEMAMRSLLVAAVAAFVAVGLAIAVGVAILRRTWRRGAILVAAALAAAAAALLWLNRAGLQNEYVPIHAFLGLWSVLLAALAGREIALLLAPRLERHPRRIAALSAAAAVLAIASGLFLARAHGDAWLLWGETGASRYLTRRWTFFTPVPDRPADLPRMVVKPDLESERTVSLRAERAAAPAPNIVILNIDSLRRDRVGAYGYTRRRITPNIDRFAARGVRFTNAFTSFPATQVFNSALLLGRYVMWGAPQQPPGYRDDAITLLLDRRSYHMFVKSWFDPSSKNRFNPRAYAIDTYVPKKRHGARMEEPLEAGMARLERHLDEARARGEPVFIWMHLLGAHLKGTHFVRDPGFDFGDEPMDRYESAVAGMDRWVGAVEERMASHLDPSRPTVWILSADHGTNPTTRSRDLYNPIVRVPLIIVAPGVEPRVDDRPVDVSLDVAATVVDLAGIAPPTSYDGVSLVPLLAGLPVDALRDRLILMNLSEWSGAVHGRYKYMRRGGVASLYDQVADPGETHNLIGERFDLAFWIADAADRELARRERDADQARAQR